MTVSLYVGFLDITTLMYYKFLCIVVVQSTPDNLNLQGKSKKVQVIGSSKKIAGSKEKTVFYCLLNILITFNVEMSSEN